MVSQPSFPPCPTPRPSMCGPVLVRSVRFSFFYPFQFLFFSFFFPFQFLSFLFSSPFNFYFSFFFFFQFLLFFFLLFFNFFLFFSSSFNFFLFFSSSFNFFLFFPFSFSNLSLFRPSLCQVSSLSIFFQLSFSLLRFEYCMVVIFSCRVLCSVLSSNLP